MEFSELILDQNPELWVQTGSVDLMIDLIAKQQNITLLDLYCIEFPFYKLSDLLQTQGLHETVINAIKAHKTPESICNERREKRMAVSTAEKEILSAMVQYS